VRGMGRGKSGWEKKFWKGGGAGKNHRRWNSKKSGSLISKKKLKATNGFGSARKKARKGGSRTNKALRQQQTIAKLGLAMRPTENQKNEGSKTRGSQKMGK